MNVETCEGCSCLVNTYMYENIAGSNPKKLKKKGQKMQDDPDWFKCKNCGFLNEP